MAGASRNLPFTKEEQKNIYVMYVFTTKQIQKRLAHDVMYFLVGWCKVHFKKDKQKKFGGRRNNYKL